MADPFAEFDAAAKAYQDQFSPSTSRAPVVAADATPSATAAEGAPTVAETEEVATQRRVQASAGEAFTRLPLARRGLAGARHLVGSMPLVRHIPGVSGFVNPQEGSEERQDLDLYRTGMPGSARVGGVLGNLAPSAVAGGIPGLMGSLPRAAIVNSGMAAGEAHLSGDNPMLAALAGGAATIPGAVLGRAITPRSSTASTATRSAQQAAIQAAQQRYAQALADVQAGVSGRSARGRFARRIPPGRAREILQQAADDLDQARFPTATIPPINQRSTSSIDRRVQQALMGMLGMGVGHGSGLNPVMTGAAGMLAPEITRAGVGAVNAGIGGVNRLINATPRPVRSGVNRYFNNQVVSDQGRALLNALSMPSTQQLVPEALDMMGLGGPIRRTLGE